MSQKTLPVMYAIKGQSVPARLTQSERVTFVRGLGVPENVAVFLGTQDRAASLVAVLQTLIERSGNETLMAQANAAVEKWSQECEAFVHNQPVRG